MTIEKRRHEPGTYSLEANEFRRRTDLDPSEKYVLRYLSEFLGAPRGICPGMAHIAREVGLTARGVQKVLSRLAMPDPERNRPRLVQVVHRGQEDGRGKTQTNLYQLTGDALSMLGLQGRTTFTLTPEQRSPLMGEQRSPMRGEQREPNTELPSDQDPKEPKRGRRPEPLPSSAGPLGNPEVSENTKKTRDSHLSTHEAAIQEVATLYVDLAKIEYEIPSLQVGAKTRNDAAKLLDLVGGNQDHAKNAVMYLVKNSTVLQAKYGLRSRNRDLGFFGMRMGPEVLSDARVWGEAWPALKEMQEHFREHPTEYPPEQLGRAYAAAVAKLKLRGIAHQELWSA